MSLPCSQGTECSRKTTERIIVHLFATGLIAEGKESGKSRGSCPGSPGGAVAWGRGDNETTDTTESLLARSLSHQTQMPPGGQDQDKLESGQSVVKHQQFFQGAKVRRQEGESRDEGRLCLKFQVNFLLIIKTHFRKKK